MKKKRSAVISTLLVPKQEKMFKPLQVCLPKSLESWREEKGITKGDGTADRGDKCNKTVSEPVIKSVQGQRSSGRSNNYWDRLDKQLLKDKLLSYFPKVSLRY